MAPAIAPKIASCQVCTVDTGGGTVDAADAVDNVSTNQATTKSTPTISRPSGISMVYQSIMLIHNKTKAKPHRGKTNKVSPVFLAISINNIEQQASVTG